MSKRNKKLQQLLENAAYELADVDTVDTSDEEEEDRILDELEENASIFVGLRYSFRGIVPKSFNWFDETLPNLDDTRFRVMRRCSRQQFNIILKLTEDHQVFHGKNSNKQFTVQFQLTLVLYRLGSNGDGATLSKISSLFGVGDGGTIDKVTSRVFQSILSLEKDVLKWPCFEERNQMVAETFDELPHCIVYADGSEIPLQERPVLDPVSYYSRNKQYSIKLQVVCDFRLKIRQVTIGYPGSAHDAKIYNNCRLATHPQRYFSGCQYLAADSAYKLTTTVMTPYRRNANILTPSQRSAFNRYFNKYRVRIEHSYGIMKEKFSSLKSLSVKISDKESHKFACTWIRVCCILYNVLLPHFDSEDFQPRTNSGNFNERIEEEEDDEEFTDIAEGKRIALGELIAEKQNS